MWLLLLEVVFAGAVVAGVAVMYWPAALILGGLLGVVACERASAGRDAARRAETARRLRPVREAA